jgi:Cu(I)/Ag(I) efflux system membrane protein CusA/SilA
VGHVATGIKTPVGIKVAGPDLEVIEGIGQELEVVLADVEGTASVYSERVAGGRYIDVDIDRKRASRFGLNIAEVQDVVRSAVGGMNVTQTVEGLERYPVNLRYPQRVRDSVEQLRLLPIVTPQGARIALADVADVRVVDGPPVIKSENARLNGWIYVDISGRDLGSYVAEAQRVVAEQVELPTGYSLAWSGQYEYMVRAQERLAVVGPVTLAIIALLLYINFRRFPEVAIILGTLPMALIGGLWLLYWLGYELSVAVGVGFIALSGVAVEIGVVMLVYLNQAIRRHMADAKSAGRSLTNGRRNHRGPAADHAGRRHRLGSHAPHCSAYGGRHGQRDDPDVDRDTGTIPDLARPFCRQGNARNGALNLGARKSHDIPGSMKRST